MGRKIKNKDPAKEPPIDVIVKIENDGGDVILFFPESLRWYFQDGDAYFVMMSWARVGEHSEASQEYMWRKCHFPRTDTERDAAAKEIVFYTQRYSVTEGFRFCRRISKRHKIATDTVQPAHVTEIQNERKF